MTLKTISINENESVLLEEYKYQPGLTDKLDNLNKMPLDQHIINEIVLWKVNRYVSVPDTLLKKIDSLKLLSRFTTCINDSTF